MLPAGLDLFYLLLLVCLCTVLMYLLQIQALREISPFTAGVSYNLEPVYSIALAVLFFGEMQDLNLYFFGGLFLIVVSVLLQTTRFLRAKPTGIAAV